MGRFLKHICTDNDPITLTQVLIVVYLWSLTAYFAGIFVRIYFPHLIHTYSQVLGYMYWISALLLVWGYAEALYAARKYHYYEKRVGLIFRDIWCSDPNTQKSVLLLLAAGFVLIWAYVGEYGLNTNAEYLLRYPARLTRQYIHMLLTGIIAFIAISTVKRAAQWLRNKILKERHRSVK